MPLNVKKYDIAYEISRTVVVVYYLFQNYIHILFQLQTFLTYTVCPRSPVHFLYRESSAMHIEADFLDI